MHSRFVLSPNPEQPGVALRVMGAMFFFLLGAIAASALYSRGDSGGSDARPVGGPTLAGAATDDGLNAFSVRDSREYTGGPIPEPTFTTQAVAAVGANETQALLDDDHSSSAASGEKQDHTANKPMRKREYNRRNATQHRQYREQSSNETARRYWNPWDWGNRFERPFAISR
jgi:hypothetical protein